MKIKVKSYSETVKGHQTTVEEGMRFTFEEPAAPALRNLTARNGWHINLSERVAIAPSRKEARLLALMMA